jgi:geranylgeranyl reductase family protein
MTEDHYDAVVVGAGPSGSLTALRLSRAGAKVALVDPSHPREKPCGGGLTARALALVGDAVDTAALPTVTVRGARFLDAAAARSAVVSLADAARLVVTSRAAFDGALFNAARAAGADARAARVLDVRRNAARVSVQTTQGPISAGCVIGADGANSLVRRRLASAFSRRQLSMATGIYAHGVSSHEILIEMITEPAGYIWSFPRPDHLAIGICAQADSGVTVGALRQILSEWLARTGIARGARLEAYSWPIPSLGPADFTTVPVAGPGWMTVGDAAGLVDPITREGIFFALQSAAWVAEALQHGGAQAWRSYQDRVRAEIGDDLARAARYKAGFFQPAFARLLLSALESSGRVREIMADLVAGTQSYRDLKWRLLKTFELGLAWKVVTAPLTVRET